jgi:phage shock protein E
MNLTTWIILAAVLVAIFAVKRMSLVSADKARRFLQDGGVLVDVRNPGEFSSGHVPGAINVPLGNLSHEAARRFRDKNQVLLLHCLSGTRSGIARGQLKKLGYNNVFNLGSYRRAEQIVRTSSPGNRGPMVGT